MIKKFFVRHHIEIFLILIITSIFLLNFGLYHYDYRFPLHADDWIHISVANDVTTGRTINELDPYFNENIMFYPRGFHVMLAEISKMSGLDMVDIARFFPAVFQSILALSIFLLLKKIVHPYAGLFGAFAVITLRTHPTILGPALLVPLNFGLILVPVMLYFFIRGYETKKPVWFFLGMSIWFVIFSFHFSSFIITTFIGVISLTEIAFLKERMKAMKAILISGVAFAVLMALFMIRFYKTDIIKTITGLVQSSGSIIISPFSPLFLVNYLIAGFALIGLIYLLTRYKVGHVTILGWTIFIFFDLYLFFQSGGTFISYERSVFYATEVLIILGAIGLYYVADFFRTYPKGLKYIPIIIFCSVLLLSFYVNVYEGRTYIYHLISEEQFQTYKWLGENYGGSKFLTNHLHSLSLPYFHLKPVQVSPMHAVPTGAFSEFGQDYYTRDVDYLYEKMKKYDATLIYAVGLDPERFEKVYDNPPIYRIK
ncbi:MAG: hypothetical protein J4473_00900 [Candidatus Aenigmarchaeota archaeon]|nr:hypothetical protein [Candidatus Aenigmarchaeota archaeon]